MREEIKIFLRILILGGVFGILIHYLWQLSILYTGAWMIIYEDNKYIVIFEILMIAVFAGYVLYEIKENSDRLLQYV